MPSINDRRKPPAPLVITNPGKVRDLVALVNGLSLFPPGGYSCPAEDGGGVRLTFLSKGGGGKIDDTAPSLRPRCAPSPWRRPAAAAGWT